MNIPKDPLMMSFMILGEKWKYRFVNDAVFMYGPDGIWAFASVGDILGVSREEVAKDLVKYRLKLKSDHVKRYVKKYLLPA